MKKKILLSLTTAAFLAFSLAACGTSSTTGTQSSTSTVKTGSEEQSSVGIATADGQSTITSSAAITPDVPSPSAEQNTGNTSEITEDQAKQVAFDHAQVKESDLTGLTVKKDYDDGISIYEIEFQAGNKKYEYDIKAADGQILKTDYEIDEDYVDSQTAQTSISEEDARALALAKVQGATDSDLRIKLEKDDGRLIYEGKIVFDQTEYDFEIDAESGDFLKWEQESVYD